jgi:NADPH:quinone reductase
MEAKRLTNGRGLAAVYDSVGMNTFEQSLACLKPRGTLVLYGSASGEVPAFELIRLAALGSLYVTRPILKHYTLTRNELLQRAKSVFESIAAGTLKLRIEHVYALDEVAQAHRDLHERSTTGKLLIVPPNPS